MAECSGNVLMKEECENRENCMKMIQAVLDGSASPEEIEHFKSNVDVCKPCFDSYELEKSIKDCLQTKVEKKCCPQNTIEQLKAKIGIGLVLLAGFILKIKVIQSIFLS